MSCNGFLKYGVSNIIYALLSLVSLVPLQVFSQADEEENIKKFAELEMKAFLSRDAKLWEDLWLHDDKITRTIVSEHDYYSVSGWNSFGPKMVSFLKGAPKVNPSTLTTDSFKIRNYKNIAWVEFNLTIAGTGKDTVNNRLTREYRFLVKENNEWKIVSQVSVSPEMFTLTPKSIEYNINNVAFQLLDDKKLEEALDMFKVNIKLYPDSWHAYDSIGEAYATIGKKKEAIESYKKSLELNPNNRIGKVALEKLQAQ